jgi:hypothetical protein
VAVDARVYVHESAPSSFQGAQRGMES